jgi:glycerol-3-phosphate dehydrogenase (NAD(P)+)
MQMRVAVIGAGSWGTTLAHLASRRTSTRLWARREDVAREIDERHTNGRYLPGFTLHHGLRASGDIAEVVHEADVVVMGVPSHGFRATLLAAASAVRPGVPVLSLAKGLEQGTNLRMTEIVAELWPGHPAGVLTGPNLSKEILAEQPAATVIAMTDQAIAGMLQEIFHTDRFRVYTNTDVLGCELAGALKNVIAVAAGMADGLGIGDNARAAVLTRGLAELTRIGVAMGGRPATFSGLAGLGDLLATCMSTQSRNRAVGEQLGRGRPIADIIGEMDQVAEGVKTVSVVRELALAHGVDTPIVDAVYAVMYQGANAGDAYQSLLRRPFRSEEPAVS